MRLQRALAQALLCPLLCAAAGGPAKRWGARITGPGNLPRKAGAAAWRPVWLERSHRCGHQAQNLPLLICTLNLPRKAGAAWRPFWFKRSHECGLQNLMPSSLKNRRQPRRAGSACWRPVWLGRNQKRVITPREWSGKSSLLPVCQG